MSFYDFMTSMAGLAGPTIARPEQEQIEKWLRSVENGRAQLEAERQLKEIRELGT